MSILDTIFKIDTEVFFAINGELQNPFFDLVMPMFRESVFWIPLYFYLLLYSITNFKKQGWYWSLMLICVASAADIISSRLIKPNMFRLRPCRDPQMQDQVEFIINYCPVSSSFTSSHAVTHFALAAFISVTFRRINPWWNLVFAWAALICFAQVYVGVHYPLDVIVGAIVGIIIGYLPGRVFNRKIGLESKNH